MRPASRVTSLTEQMRLQWDESFALWARQLGLGMPTVARAQQQGEGFFLNKKDLQLFKRMKMITECR